MDKLHYLTIGIVAIFLIDIGLLLGRQGSGTYYSPPQNVEYKNHVAGINTGFLEAGNYTFQTQVTNPYENRSIRIYSFLFSDPENTTASFECTVKNGTKILPLESVMAIYDIIIFSEAEYYVRIGCLKEGEDY